MSHQPKNYEVWVKTLPASITSSPIWRMEAYRDALFAFELAWHDTRKLKPHPDMLPVSRQLYHAVGSIGANIAEGYGRNSVNDRIRFYEYALGSADEAQLWYAGIRYIISDAVFFHRSEHIAKIARQIVKLIPQQRNLREDSENYDVDDE